MDKDVIINKLASLKRCLQRVEEKVPESTDALQENIDAQDIISLNLQRTIQLCVDIAAFLISETELNAPMSMADSFEKLAQAKIISYSVCNSMKKAAGFRNIVVHDYCSINWDIVFVVSTEHIKDFQAFAREIMDFLDKNKEA